MLELPHIVPGTMYSVFFLRFPIIRYVTSLQCVKGHSKLLWLDRALHTVVRPLALYQKDDPITTLRYPTVKLYKEGNTLTVSRGNPAVEGESLEVMGGAVQGISFWE